MANTKEEVTKLIIDINEEQHNVYILQQTIINKKTRIRHLQQQLWDTCSHVWVRDPWANFDELCKHNCSICGLWKDRGMYT